MCPLWLTVQEPLEESGSIGAICPAYFPTLVQISGVSLDSFTVLRSDRHLPERLIQLFARFDNLIRKFLVVAEEPSRLLAQRHHNRASQRRNIDDSLGFVLSASVG